MRKQILLIITVLCIAVSAQAAVRLPSFFSDHMVLQRNSKVDFWGWAGAAQFIQIIPSWSNDTVKVRADGYAKWKAALKTPEAGGPYTITFIAPDNKIVLEDVMIGEVWLCSGQSNMVWNSNNKHQEMLAELPTINNNNIRVLQVPNVSSLNPQDDLKASWKTASPESIKGFSSIAYFIAKKLQKELNMPIGVINSSWGGTPAEVWTPQETINSDAVLKSYADLQKPAISRPHTAGSLWNAMVYPLVGYRIAGVYWYQGESNVSGWQGYGQLFSAMIGAWRKAWGYEFPFYYVQIAPHTYKTATGNLSSMLREQQSRTLSLVKTGMVVTTDLVPDVSNIHPEKKIDVANRLADLALVETYGQPKTDYKSPVYEKIEVKGDKIIVHFKYLEKGLSVKGKDITEIKIAGEDGNFKEAKAIIKGNTLEVSSKEIKKPEAVRFGFTDTAMPNLFNSKGLPVAPFRTDSWSN
ncbi:sialate O-acetylesterase [Pedobacter helvus]|uniref:Sialate O-acetylesterase n=1 Tax=Pedobacter helvus TaxID=2563444 RepID=A0ABW9JPN7_9SPHI|nr:sialate O-acetylesterase [Pedobacter ureilyticus]